MVGHRVGHHAARADDGVLSDDDVGEDRRSRSDRRAPVYQRPLHRPIVRGLQLAGRRRGARIRVVDEGDAVADEDMVLDGDAFTDEGMTGDLAPGADARVLLNLDEGPDLRLVADLAAV